MASNNRNQAALSRMYKLESYYGTYKSKCRRNLRMYEYSPTISLENLTDDQVVGYYQQGTFDIEDDTTSSVQENVIKSCIDTLVSKIASQKVRPYINTVNGTFREIQIAKQARDYFDSVFDEQNANKVISDAFRDACVFDKGIIYVDKDQKRIERILPWQVFVDPREYTYGRLTHAAYKQNNYPGRLLEKDSNEEYTYWQYWDLNEQKKYSYIVELDKWKVEDWDCNSLPFIFLTYNNPIKATSSQSVVDLLYGIQMEIDMIMTKIKDASEVVPVQSFFVPSSSSIKVEKLSNRSGQLITYTPTPNMTGSPITSSSTPFMDPQWMATVESLKQHAYEICGISQLSASSKKPTGLNSGIALSTMEDIESDRFETQLNTVIRAYTDLAKLMIQVYPPEEDILPANRFRQTITWGDIVEMRDQMNIQFSAAEQFSKDPSQKLAQLQSLYAAGLIPQSRIAQLMDMPDIQLGYSIINNSINAVLTVIDDCIERDIYEIPDYVPNQMLCEEIINTMLSLKAANNPDNLQDIEKLKELYRLAMAKNVDAQTNAEMAASSQLLQDVENDLNDPNGMINSSIQNGISANVMQAQQGV